MKRLITFILSVLLLCTVGAFFGCETAEVDNTDYTAFLEFTEIKDGDNVTGYSVKSKEGSTEKDIVIPAKYKGKPVEIAEGAFWPNDIIESVVIKNGVTKMGRLAFARCTKLKKVTLPNSMTELASAAFSECPALEDITLPKSIKTVNDQVFLECTALKSITLSRKDVEIQHSAFYKCENLKEVYWYDELPKGVDGDGYIEGTIDYEKNVCFLSYPTMQLEHYVAHAKWYHYSKTKPIYDENDRITYYNLYWHYDKNGQKVKWPNY